MARAQAGRHRRRRAAVPLQGGRNDVERILGAAPEALRVRKPRNHLEEFHDGAGPTVRDQERHGVGGGARVNEVQVEAVYRRHELRQRIDPPLGGAPIEPFAPVAAEFGEVGKGCSIAPGPIVQLLRQRARSMRRWKSAIHRVPQNRTA